MAELTIAISKRTDGDVVLRCTRADGSATWQRVRDTQAAFFPRHDLAHYAVETELSFRAGFYGLIAGGWDIEDTGGKGRRGRLPAETVLVEHIVGILDLERASGTPSSAADFNAQLAETAANRGLPQPAPMTDEELDRLRDRVRQLFASWAAVPPGGALELAFDRPATTRASTEPPAPTVRSGS